MSVKIPIALRLFLAVLLTAVIVAATGLFLLQAGLEESFARYVAELEVARLAPVASVLESEYKKNSGWPDIPDRERREWLRGAFAHLRHLPFAGFSGLFPENGGPPPIPGENRFGPPGMPPGGLPPLDDKHRINGPQPPDRLGLRERTGLVDAQGHYLAGMPATPKAARRTLTVDGKTIGYLTVAPAADPRDALSQEFLEDQTRNLLLIASVCIVMSALAAALLAIHFRRPIGQLVTGARALTRGQFDTRLHVHRSDELGSLADTFNHLATMLERHDASRRQWVADTSHELRTPLSVLRAQIEAVQDGVRPANPEMLAAMQRQVMILGKLVDDLYELARADVGQLSYHMEALDVGAIIVQEAGDYRDRLREKGLALRIEEPLLPLYKLGDAARLRQIIGNLLQNSLRYTDTGGEVVISTQLHAGEWQLHVDDSAPGVPAEALGHLGERFFRVERSRNRELGGSGLGLALCQRIAQAHGGGLRFMPSPLGGLKVIFFLPLEDAT